MARTYTNLVYHLVFSTRQRRPDLDGPWVDSLYSYVGGIVRGNGGVLDEIGGIEDHLHLLARLRATTALSDLMRDMKARSSAWINEHEHCPGFRWQRGFGAFTVSESVAPRLRAYIRNQRQHHAQMTSHAEMAQLLDRHGVPFNLANL
jgi:REP element-mobilizing transposase RayT